MRSYKFKLLRPIVRVLNLKFYLRSIIDLQIKTVDMMEAFIASSELQMKQIDSFHTQLKSNVNNLIELNNEEIRSKEELNRKFTVLNNKVSELQLLATSQSNELSLHAKLIGSKIDKLPSEYVRKKIFTKNYLDAFRGTRNQVLKSYEINHSKTIEFISRKKNKSALNFLDLGCGRGEWLEFLKNKNHNVYGIDLYLDDSCVHLKEDIKVGDIVDCISYLPKNSYDVISFFHVLEHFGINTICNILEKINIIGNENFNLLIEVPNVANPFVSSTNFYNDPTHRTKLPLEYLEHILTEFGFTIIDKKFQSYNLKQHDLLSKDSHKKIDFRYTHLDLFIMAEKKKINESCCH